ncbi:glycosyltransferase [Candidatus Magnetominusculus xianensis]|nr:glycosyltransferase [Candidatus Magnetominusculus xianensis]MBF0402821.1 glycosyltransferase [Nitrospirota bacterium]
MTNLLMTAKRSKVLHLITGMEVGGAEKMLLRIVPRMEGAFENRVCVIKDRGRLGPELEQTGIPVVYLDLKSPFNLQPILRFRRLAAEFKPDILVTYLIHADLFGRICGRAFGIKRIVCYQRGSLLNWEFLRTFDRLTKPLVTKYIVQTETAKEELTAALKISGEKIAVIGNAIDTTTFDLDKAAKKKELGLNPNNKTIVCVGNLREGKGHEYLLDAFEELFSKRFPGINLLIVGGGQKKKQLVEQIKPFTSQANIHFLGSRDDVREILKISDLFVLPTLYEGMSNAIMEAMASKVAIITTDIPVNAELAGDTAVLVPIKNSAKLAEAMEMLLSDNSLRNGLAQRAYSKITSQYSLDVVVQKYTTLLKDILNAI